MSKSPPKSRRELERENARLLKEFGRMDEAHLDENERLRSKMSEWRVYAEGLADEVKGLRME